MVVRELLVRFGIQSDPKQFNRTEKSLNKLSRVAKGAAAVFATGAVAVGFKKLVDLASDASETANKFGAVFEEAASNTQKSLDQISKSTGASNIQLQAMSSNLGAILKPALGSADAAGEMSAQLSKAALDIASFNNLKPEEALQRLRAGLLGSTEPLDAVGVNLRANNIGLKEYAERMGISATEVSAAAKVQLRFQAIMEQLGTQGALGDATRTQFGFANASRNLQGQLKELGATVGKFFLNSVEKSTGGLLRLVKQFNAWFRANREIIQQGIDRVMSTIGGVLRGLGTAIKFVADLFTAWFSVLSEGEQQLSAFLIGLGILIGLLGLPTVLLLAIGAAIALVIDDFEAMGRGAESVTGTIIDGFNDLVKVTGSISGAIKQMLTNAFTFWIDKAMKAFPRFMDMLEKFLRRVDKIIAPFRNIFGSIFGDNEESPAGGGVPAISPQRMAELQRFAGVRPGVASAAGGGGGTNITSNPNTTISVNVQAAPGMNEADLANETAKQIEDRQSTMLRQTASALGISVPAT